MAIPGEIYVVLQPSLEKRLYLHVTDLVYRLYIEIETYKNRGTCRCKPNIVSEVSSVREIFYLIVCILTELISAVVLIVEKKL